MIIFMGTMSMTKLLNPPKLAAVDFDRLSQSRLQEMVAAGDEVLECHRVLARSGDNVVGGVLRDGGTFTEWNHYPEGDVFDH